MRFDEPPIHLNVRALEQVVHINATLPQILRLTLVALAVQAARVLAGQVDYDVGMARGLDLIERNALVKWRVTRIELLVPLLSRGVRGR